MSGSVWYISFSKKKIEFKKYPKKKKIRSKNVNIKKNFVIGLLFLTTLIFFLSLTSAAAINDTFHINLQTTFSNGSIQTGTFAFAFNITENSSTLCGQPIVYNHSTSLATDSRGIVSLYLPTVGSGGGNLSQLSFDKQYYLCYYRDGTLKNVSQLARVPYSFRATEVNLSEITVDSNLDLNTTGQYNITANYGFFSFLGNLANRISSLFVGSINATGDINASGIFRGNGSGLTNVDSATIDGYDSGFFMPLNTSVYGNFDFNGGWQNNGLSIIDGDIYAQTGFFYNITSLNVTRQNLTINDDLLVFGNTNLSKNLTVDTNTLFVNSNTDRVGIGTTSLGAKLEVDSGNTSEKGIIVKAITNQTANLQEWQSNASVGRLVVNNESQLLFHVPTSSTDARGFVGNSEKSMGLIHFWGGRGFTYGSGTELIFYQASTSNVLDPSATFSQKFKVADTGFVIGIGEINRAGYQSGGSHTFTIEESQKVPHIELVQRDVSSPPSSGTHGAITWQRTIGATGTTARIEVKPDTGGDLNSSIIFMTNNGTTLAEKFRINSLGNIGINTTTPQNTLNVLGTGNITGATYLGNSKCAAGYVLTTDAITGLVSCTLASSLSGVVNGSGTYGYIPMWNATNTLNNSAIYQNGSNIGIGTIEPKYSTGTLNVGATTLTIFNNASEGGGLELASNTSTDFTTIGRIGFVATQNSNNKTVAFIDGLLNGSAGTDRGGWLRFATKNNGSGVIPQVRMTIDPTGNVGIGTASPNNVLEVFNNYSSDNNSIQTVARFTRGYSGTGGGAAGIGSRIILGAVASDGAQRTPAGISGFLINATAGFVTGGIGFETSDAGVLAEKMRIDNSGNVGIGTASPSYLLDVAKSSVGGEITSRTYNSDGTNTGSGARGIIMTNGSGAGDPRLVLSVEGVREYNVGIDNSDSDKFKIGGDSTVGTTPYLTIDTSGNVGIGTTGPGAKLEIYTSAAGLNTNWNTAVGNYAWNAFQVGGIDKGYVQWNINDAANAVGTAMLINNIQGKLHLRDNTGTGMTISGGNVGIGTTSPSYLLDVAKSSVGGEITSRTYNSDGTNTGSGARGIIMTNGSGAGDPRLVLSVEGVREYNVGIDNSDSDKFKIGGDSTVGTTPYLTIDTSGNVGIGTTSPTHLLSISGGTNSYDLRFGNVVGETGITLLADNANTERADIRRYAGYLSLLASTSSSTPATTEGITILNGGNVGIGTTSPNDLLHIRNATANSDPGIRIGNDAEDWRIRIMGSDADKLYFSSVAGATNALVLTPAGNVGIGTTSPRNKLEIIGVGAYGTESTNDLRISTNSSSTADVIQLGYDTSIGAGYLRAYQAGTGVRPLVINPQGGNVGIGITSPSSLLDLKGTPDSGRFLAFTTGFTGAGRKNWEIAREYVNVGDIGFRYSSADNGVPDTTALYMQGSNGNVGIGTTSPAGKLHINGTNPQFYFGEGTGANEYAIIEWNNANNYFSLHTQAVDPQLILAANGNVGIGTASPGQKLTIAGDQAGMRFENTGGAANEKYWDIYPQTAGPNLHFRSLNDAQTLEASWLDVYRNAGTYTINKVVFPNGNVGIGNSGPNYKLDVGPIGGTQTTTSGALGLIRNNAAADLSPFTQARIIVYGGTSVDISNWGYLAYGSDASMREVYAKTGAGNSLLWGTSSAMDGTGTFTQTMSLTTGGLLTTAGDFNVDGGEIYAVGTTPWLEVSGCGANTGVSSVSASGTITCTADTGTGTMSSWTIAGDDDSSTVSNGETATIAGSGTIDTVQTTRTVAISVQGDSIGDTQLAFNTGQALTTASTPQFARLGLGAAADGTYLLNLNGALVHGTSTGVGIGTTTPQNKLNVVGGDINASGLLYQKSTMPAVAVVGRVNTDAGTGANTAETTLHTITVPGNTMGSNGALRITVKYKITGTSDTKSLYIKYGGTVFAGLTHFSATNGEYGAEVLITNRGSTSSQMIMRLMSDGGGPGSAQFTGGTTGTVDSTANQDVVISAATPNSADELTAQFTIVEVLPS